MLKRSAEKIPVSKIDRLLDCIYPSYEENILFERLSLVTFELQRTGGQ